MKRGTHTILKCMIHGLQEAALLRVQEDSLIGCDGKKGCVEGCDVFFQVVGMPDIHLDL